MPPATPLRQPAAATHGRIQDSGFRAHPLLRNPHLQTMLPALLRPTPPLDLRRERLELDDGDFVDLGWAGTEQTGAPTAVLVHGLTGGFESKYLRGLALQLIDLGWRICALQLRGGGESPNRLARCYHHGDSADLRHLWHLLRRREPEGIVATVGWSLGGNVVLKALGEEGDQAPVDFAAAASVPFSLYECAERLRHGVARIYQSHLLGALRRMIRHKASRVDLSAIDLDAVLSAPDFFTFDDGFTAPLNGFADAQDYYARAACGPYLQAIRRPTLIVHAQDDPMMVREIIPRAEALSPFVTLQLSTHGGHVGFVEAGPRGRPRMWLERHFADYLQRQRVEREGASRAVA
ncbi:MAG: hydrolase [Gammaproteobacteria bacterium]|nr:hydrolase [Gammaproteobacteria bacterium]